MKIFKSNNILENEVGKPLKPKLKKNEMVTTMVLVSKYGKLKLTKQRIYTKRSRK